MGFMYAMLTWEKLVIFIMRIPKTAKPLRRSSEWILLVEHIDCKLVDIIGYFFFSWLNTKSNIKPKPNAMNRYTDPSKFVYFCNKNERITPIIKNALQLLNMFIFLG